MSKLHFSKKVVVLTQLGWIFPVGVRTNSLAQIETQAKELGYNLNEAEKEVITRWLAK